MKDELQKLSKDKLIDLILEYNDYIDNYYYYDLIGVDTPMNITEYIIEEERKREKCKD